MLKSYQRRAFVILVFASLIPDSASAQESLWDVLSRADKTTPEPAKPALATATDKPSAPTLTAAPAPRATESLWDILGRADRAPLTSAQVNVIAPATVRRPLGPVPGFTLPAPKRAAEENLSLFSKNKKRSGGFLGGIGNWFNHMQEVTGTKIKVTGHHTFSFRSEQITGNAESFRSDQYFGRGNNGFYSDTDMTVEATLFKHFRYETRISNSLFNNPYDPNNNRVRLDYNTERLRVEWGNINAGFQGNSLIDFNRFLYGAQIKNKWSSEFNTSLLYSETRAETRTITISGNNSAGPYYVYAGQIVEGSDRVRLNERELLKGRDYTLDTYTGELNFIGGRIALQTDAIAVTFETVGFNQQRGSIYGLRAEYTPKSGSRLGVTYVTQQARGSNAPQARIQQFYGFGAPGAAYLLDAPADPTKPIIVSIAGVPLVQGIDYALDASLTNQIRIAQAVPPTVIIQVQYFPLNVTPVPGNRSVMGADGRISLGRLGSLTTEFALSGLSLSDNNIGGQAYQVRADLTPFRNLNTSITLRNISPTFSSIQSPGFNRNERSVEFSSDYALSNNTRLSFNMQRAKRPSYSGGFGLSQFDVTTNGEDDYNQTNFSISNSFAFNLARRPQKSKTDAVEPTKTETPGNPENRAEESKPEEGSVEAQPPHTGIPEMLDEETQRRMNKGKLTGTLSFTRSNLGSTFATGGSTNNVNDNLSLNFSLRSVTFNFGLTRNTNAADSFFNIGAGGGSGTGQQQLYSSRAATEGRQMGIAWQPFKWLQFSGSQSTNNIRSTGNDLANNTTARDTQFTATITPSRDIRLRYTHQLSDTGNLFNPSPGTNTGGTTGGGGGDVIGTPTRAPLPFLMHTRQAPITAGGSGSGATNPIGGNAFGATTFGGGAFANLGGFGNYSGFYGNNFNNGYGVSSFGGRNRSNTFALDWTLKSNMALGIQYTNASSIGDYQYNSSRDGLNFNFNWQPSDRMQLSLSQGFQNVAYNGGLGGSNSISSLVSLSGRPFGGKLNMQVSWQSVQTNSNLNFGALNPGSGDSLVPTDTSLSLNSLSGRVDYPLSSRYTLFAEFLNSSSIGYLGSSENNLRFGVDYALVRNLRLSVGWQIFNRLYSDPQYEQYNYKVSTLLAELGFRF